MCVSISSVSAGAVRPGAVRRLVRKHSGRCSSTLWHMQLSNSAAVEMHVPILPAMTTYFLESLTRVHLLCLMPMLPPLYVQVAQPGPCSCRTCQCPQCGITSMAVQCDILDCPPYKHVIATSLPL
jgi:hypothetical protein